MLPKLENGDFLEYILPMSTLGKINTKLKRDPRLESFIKFSLKKLPRNAKQNHKISLIELGTNFTGTIDMSYFTRIWLDGGQRLIGFRPLEINNFLASFGSTAKPAQNMHPP